VSGAREETKHRRTPSGVEGFIRQSPQNIRPLLRELRKLVKEILPEAREEIKWGRPVYSLQRIVCYLASAESHASLGFYRGIDLHDPKELLEGTGKKLRHIKVRRLQDIRKRPFSSLLRQSKKLDAG